jgi:hypothetical protein
MWRDFLRKICVVEVGPQVIQPVKSRAVVPSHVVTVLSFGVSLLGVDVFEGSKKPKDINSPGLCGTFKYSVD